DEAVADLRLVHGGSCLGEGQRTLTQECTDGHGACQGTVGWEEKSVARNRISRNAPCPWGRDKLPGRPRQRQETLLRPARDRLPPALCDGILLRRRQPARPGRST